MIVVLCESMDQAKIMWNTFLDWIDELRLDSVWLRPDLCVERIKTRERWLFSDYRISDVLDPDGTSKYYRFVDEYDFIEDLYAIKMAIDNDILSREEALTEDCFYYDRIHDAFLHPVDDY